MSINFIFFNGKFLKTKKNEVTEPLSDPLNVVGTPGAAPFITNQEPHEFPTYTEKVLICKFCFWWNKKHMYTFNDKNESDNMYI